MDSIRAGSTGPWWAVCTSRCMRGSSIATARRSRDASASATACRSSSIRHRVHQERRILVICRCRRACAVPTVLLMADRTSYDVIVIGAGVLGASIALELARAGRSVVAVDRGPGAGTGSTSASSAVVRFNYSTWTGVVAAWESKHLWEKWGDHLGAPADAPLARFVRTGGLLLESPGQDRGRVLALFDRAGVPYEEW